MFCIGRKKGNNNFFKHTKEYGSVLLTIRNGKKLNLMPNSKTKKKSFKIENPSGFSYFHC